MLANGRWDLIRRLKVNTRVVNAGFVVDVPRPNVHCDEGTIEGTAIMSIPVAEMRLLLCEV